MLTLEQKLMLACLSAVPDSDQLPHLVKQCPNWQQLFTLGEEHGVLPQIYKTLNLFSLQLPAEVLEPFRRWFAASALRGMQLHQELRRLIELFKAEGLPVIPFKGPVLAEEVYGDIAMRSFVDLDLLVPRERTWDALQLLQEQGFCTDFDLPRARWAGLQRVENHLPLYRPEQDWFVELHWSLFHPKYVQPFDLSLHWAALEGGREGRLDREETLVMLCVHGTKHFWGQLKWLVDIDRLLRSGASLNWTRALSLAGGSGATRSLLLALNLSRTLLGTPLCAAVVAKIDGDAAVKPLTEAVVANLFSVAGESKRLQRDYAFYLRSRDTLLDRVTQVVRWLFLPRRADWELFRLGDWWHGLYYVQRPVRMVFKHLVRPLLLGTLINAERND